MFQPSYDEPNKQVVNIQPQYPPQYQQYPPQIQVKQEDTGFWHWIKHNKLATIIIILIIIGLIWWFCYKKGAGMDDATQVTLPSSGSYGKSPITITKTRLGQTGSFY